MDIIGNNEVGGLVGTLLANEPASVLVENNLYSGFVDAKNGIAGGLFGTIAPIEGNIIKNNMALAVSVTGSTKAGAFSGTEPGVVLGTGNVVLDSMTVNAASVTDTPSDVAIKNVVD